MPRLLRHYLLTCNVLTFAYLIWYAVEPLRLNIGDPWADAQLVASWTRGASAPVTVDVVATSHLSTIVYGVIAKLGFTDIAVFRVFALVFSALGAWALFQYLRRMWSDRVALVGTTLFTTSLLSLMHADSLQAPPLARAGCFIALWGLVRVVETAQLGHYAVAAVGAFTCLCAASDDGLFLSATVLITVYAKRGDPLARGNFRFVLVCIAGGVAGALARAHLAVEPAEWPGLLDAKLAAPLLPLLTVTLTPTLWIATVYAAWRVVRFPSLRAALEDAMSWLVVVAVLAVCVLPPRPGPPMLRVVSILPFFAVGSAIVIDRLFQARRLSRGLAVAWVAVATVWGFAIALRQPRAVLERDDVAAARAYLANNDGNDFVMSNLLSDGVIEAAFARQSWSPIGENDNATDPNADRGMRIRLLEAFAAAGTNYVHAVILTSPASRFVDRSLGQLARYRGLGLATAWPYVRRTRAEALIQAYDGKMRQLLDATGATRVLHFASFDVYRIDRGKVLERAGQSIEIVRKQDFNSPAADRYKLLGWRGPRVSDTRKLGVSTIAGHAVCANPVVEARTGAPVRSTCETMTSRAELYVGDARLVDAAQVMIRVDRACDVRLTVEIEPVTLSFLADLTSPGLGVSLGGFTASQCASSGRVSFVVPARFVHDGINIVTLSTRSLGPLSPRADVRALEIEPICDASR